MRANRMGWAVAAALLAATPRAASPAEGTYIVAGELVRVSLPRSSVTVKLAGPPVREIEVRVGPGTVMSSRGRPLRLADLRTGEQVLASCTDDIAGVRHAQRMKLGGKPR